MSKLIPLFSGSSGNSYYLASGGEGILIDVGRSAKQTLKALSDNNVDPRTIRAVFVTHEHCDHVNGVRVFANKLGIPVFSTRGTYDEMIKNGYADGKTDCRIIGSGGVDLDNMHIDSFPVSHDCAEGCGYRVDLGTAKFALATDLGYVSEAVENALSGCNAVVIESNHDLSMLRVGPYPYPLKRRIMSETGHLSNEMCASFLPKLVKSGAGRFVLAHLSKENNMPEIAYREALNTLTAEGMSVDLDYTLDVAPVVTNGKAVLF